MRRIIIGVLMAIALAAALTACGSSSGHSYPANAKTNFLNACEVQGSVSTCDCLLNKIEAHVSLSDFIAADTAARNGDAAPSWLLKYAGECA